MIDLGESMKLHAQHPAWLAVVAYATQMRAAMDENIRFRGAPERECDFYRGQAAVYTEILSIHDKLTHPEPDHGE